MSVRPVSAVVARREASSDAAAIASSLADGRAFELVFDRHWVAIHSFCASRVGSAGEDIAAETFRVAFDGRRRFDGRCDDARPWLYGIASNLIRRHFRTSERGRRALRRSAPLEPVDGVEDTLGRLEAQRLGPQLAAAMRALSAEERDALLLLAWAGLSYEEIARALDIPIGTVRSRIHRARASIQSYVNREDI
jgi:RNA polymerase sigma-70 factor (ECF subfamily)